MRGPAVASASQLPWCWCEAGRQGAEEVGTDTCRAGRWGGFQVTSFFKPGRCYKILSW